MTYTWLVKWKKVYIKASLGMQKSASYGKQGSLLLTFSTLSDINGRPEGRTKLGAPTSLSS